MARAHELGAAAALVLLVACGGGGDAPRLDAGESDASTAPDVVDDASNADAGAADSNPVADARDAPLTVFFAGTIYRRKSDLFILGAEVCLLNQPQAACEITDSVGRFRFAVPPDTNLAVTVRAPGFGSSLVAFRSGRSDLTGFTITLLTDESEKTYYGAAGVDWPSTTRGFLFVFANDMMNLQLAGLTMSLSPSSGSGPFYDDANGAPDKTLQATSAIGTTHFGGVAPGDLEVSFGPSNLFCSAIVGAWPSEHPGMVRVPVVAGVETIVGVRCF